MVELFYFMHVRKGKIFIIDIVIKVRCNKWFPAKEEVTQEIFQVHSCWFSFSALINSITKATEFVTFVFLSVFWFSSPSRKAWTPLSESDTDFSAFLAAIIRKKSDKRPWIENGESFAVHWPDREARKASDVSATDWRYYTHVKKYNIFSSVLLRLFSGQEILVVYMTNTLFRPLVNQFMTILALQIHFETNISLSTNAIWERERRINKLFIGLR